MSNHIIRNNELLMLGTGILIIGVILTSYSLSSYVEMKKLGQRIDFETVDQNNQMSSTEKYYRYMEYSDFLNHKLKENRRIPVKNASCAYLDYAYHNSVMMYKLTKNKMSADEMKTKFSADNVKMLYDTMSDYKSCKQTAEYKVILGQILEEIQNSDKEKIKADERMNEFLYGSSTKLPQYQEEPDSIVPQDYQTSSVQNLDSEPTPNYIDENGKAQTLTPAQIERINQQQQTRSQIQNEQ